ncbi:MAG: DUF4178 domain-containing protein [Bacteroidetes bacterium]|nr:DUF4178 domain-containing protein [Bacteroidota bacterium]
MTTTCANCGGPVRFKDRFSVNCVCTHCGSMLVRVDDYTRALGTVADMPDDNSPLQTGATGKYDGKAFEVVGRLKVQYHSGMWNEWYLYFANDTIGWLAEAQGFWMLSFPAKDNPPIPPLSELKLGKWQKLAGIEYIPIDFKKITYAGIEGELPFRLAPEDQATVVDLAGQHQRFATLDYPKGEEAPRLYLGRYVHFDSLNLHNLRSLHGWKF